MIIKVTVSGGWAGLRSTCVIDTTLIEPHQAADIELAIGRCFEHEMPPPTARVRDARTYRVEAEENGETQVLLFDEIAPPAEALSMLRVVRPLCPDLI